MTISPGGGGCPDEVNTPPGAPSPVDDSEQIIRCVCVSTDLVWQNGVAALDIGLIGKSDLEGKNGKSVSVLRHPPLTPAGDVAQRATALNLQNEWLTDPVVAIADAIELRRLIDAYQISWRLVCVHAEPTDNTDPLGACPTHAGIVRSNPHPKPGKQQRLEWLKTRLAVAATFKDIAHLSGAAVARIP
jgi:hypothetical protein